MRPRTVALLVALALLPVGCSRGSSASPGASTPPPQTHTSAQAARATTERLTARRAGWVLPGARSREVVLSTTAGLLVAGGLSSARVSTDSVWLVRPRDGRLVSTGRLATAVHDATGFALDGAAYVAGGGASTTVGGVQRLAPGAVAVTVGRLPQPRSDLSSATIGAAAYVLGGFDGTRSIAAVLRTTDGRTFTTVTRLAVTVRYAAAVAVGDRLLVIGGEHDGVGVSDVQEVDLRTRRTSVVARLPFPLSHEAAFVTSGGIWLAGGRSNAVLQRSIWRFDPAAGRLHRAGTLPYAVADAGVAVVGSTAYLVGGEAPAPVASVVVLRPAR